MGQSGADVTFSAAKLIIESIRAKQLIAFDYDGVTRVVEPHTYGIDGQDREIVCGYQIEGGSRSGNPVGWKFFRIADIRRLRADTRHFTMPRPEYQRGDRAFARIIAEL